MIARFKLTVLSNADELNISFSGDTPMSIYWQKYRIHVLMMNLIYQVHFYIEEMFLSRMHDFIIIIKL